MLERAGGGVVVDVVVVSTSMGLGIRWKGYEIEVGLPTFFLRVLPHRRLTKGPLVFQLP